MKKFWKWSLVALLALLVVAALALVACNIIDDPQNPDDPNSDDKEHKHAFSQEWTGDEKYHWHAATCEHTTEVKDKAEHSFGSDGKCSVCNSYGTNGVMYGTSETGDDAYAYVMSFDNVSNDIVILDYYKGLPVTSIENEAFYDCWNLKSVTIPGSVTSMGEKAFYRCSNLQTVTFKGKSQLQSIGESAFSYCSSLTEITIPSIVTSIGDDAFNCVRLIIYCETAAKPSDWHNNWNSGCPVVWNCLHNNVNSDGYFYAVADGVRYAIKDDTATVVPYIYSGNVKILSQVEYSGKQYLVTNIGEQTFYWCSSLNNITIPSSVTSIGERVLLKVAAICKQ